MKRPGTNPDRPKTVNDYGLQTGGRRIECARSRDPRARIPAGSLGHATVRAWPPETALAAVLCQAVRRQVALAAGGEAPHRVGLLP